MLHEFVDLIERLSFELSKLIALKKYFHARNSRNSLENFKFLLVTNNVRNEKETKMRTIKREKISKK